MRCRHCGHENLESSRFCMHCGVQADPPDSVNVKAPAGHSRSRPLRGNFGLIALLSAIGGSALFITAEVGVLSHSQSTMQAASTAVTIATLETKDIPTLLPAPTPAAVTSSPTETRGDQPIATLTPESSLPLLIQQVDEEQIQALASGDPTVMQNSATHEFYQEQIENNEQLRQAGVTAIALVTLEFGTISSNDATATAVVWETWKTTFADGTTEQSRDRNVYTVVRDNGVWKVSSDEHPDQPAPTPTAGR